VSPVNRDASPFTLRPYQEHTVDAHRAAHTGGRRPSGTGTVNRTVSILATGLGKTVIASEMFRRGLARRERGLFLVHREELAHQAMRTMHSMNPGASIGLVKAERDEWEADIVVASVPTLGRSAKRRERIPADRFGQIIADECHHAAADTWQSTLAYFGAFNGRPTAGITATLSRGDSRALGDTWSEVVAEYDISFGVRNRFLVKPTGRRIRVKDLMLEQVKKSRGDYQDDDLGAAMENADAGNAIAKAYLEHAAGRRAAMFCPNVSSARRFADDLNEAGIPTEVVVGTSTTEERTAIYERFRTGETLVISSCMVITEGWDAPWAEVAIMARPTTSAALYIQCVGRVLRPWAPGGKTSALVLDVVGVSENHRLASLKELAGKDADGREELSGLYEDEELEEDAGEGTWTEVRDRVEGDLVATEVDLFADSDSSWLQTDRGVWFVPTSVSYWFLYLQPDGGYSLGRISTGGGKAERVERDLTLEAGMAWAEKYTEDEDHTISSRKAYWRKRFPSEKMLALAASMGIPSEGLHQGELSDVITTGRASVALRKFAPRV
jgi:superfamily II DNA or RNA helicase